MPAVVELLTFVVELSACVVELMVAVVELYCVIPTYPTYEKVMGLCGKMVALNGRGF